ncbi:MAG: bifunctional methylenetetrahydrofolate dehydrogenase/methenyltetrahydrofolate cyclohydrolase FolD [Bacilli bacterium]|nr:bifunctional methylenetetrahydrofolate dehydrogenase/methenyltetrahydrofolate cyclohydrolase FolD [Bacilli bacterium]
MKIIDGKKISEEIKAELKAEVKNCFIKPGLSVIQIGNREDSNKYVSAKQKAALEVGINFNLYHYDETADEREIVNKIKELNNDEYVDGIMIQLPLPDKFNEKKLINLILPSKDVDGLTDRNIGRLVTNKDPLTSCTPLGIIELLKRSEVKIEGKNVVIVGRSNLVGKPLMHLFLNENATVTVCHTKTSDLKKMTLQADILVAAMGNPKFITKDYVKEGAVVIDVGINTINSGLCGDVDFDNVSKKASLITPVPGGVGPMTVTMLLKNTLKSYNLKNSK